MHQYRLFDLPDLFSPLHRSFALRRFVVGFIIVDIAPIAFLWFLYTYIVPNTSGATPVVAAAVSVLAVFGFIRVLHALVASDSMHHLFFPDEEYEKIASEWIRRGSNSFWAHFIPGAVYLIIFPIIAFLIGGKA